MSTVSHAELLPPEDDRPAPGRLVLVQALVNSVDRLTGADALATPAGAAAWLRRAGCPGAGSEADRTRLVALREALRDLLAANAGLPGGEAAVRAAAQTLARSGGRTAAEVGPDGTVRLAGAGEGVDRLAGEVLAAVHEAQLTGTWARLKACADETCRWAFYDASRNRAGAWCSMADCGNRTKVRRFRARRAGRAGDGAPGAP